ncbi:transcription factor S-II, central domain-containing protein [Syncephalis fuscata]|nr:transcription factor S-II, central domain-containing protein [Syncephalis fuscata]
MEKLHDVHDPVRRKCARMLANALRGEDESTSSSQNDTIMQIAAETEKGLFERANCQVTPDYKTAVRSRLWNLRNPKNPQLREQLIQGELTPYHFARMSDEEMSSEEQRKEMRRMRRETMRDAIGRDHMLQMAIHDPEEPLERWPINELEPDERDPYPGASET